MFKPLPRDVGRAAVPKGRPTAPTLSRKVLLDSDIAPGTSDSEPGGSELSVAKECADLDPPLPPGTRLRGPKQILMRVLRIVTRRQTSFNRAILAAVEQLAARAQVVQRCSAAVESDSFEELQAESASVRSDLVEIQQRLVALARSSDSRSEPPDLVLLTDTPRADARTSEGKQKAADHEKPAGGLPGVNVFGDWAATTGLAQAARRMAVAMAESGLDMSVQTVRSGAPIDESRVPQVLSRAPGGRPFEVDLWMLNVNELLEVPDELIRPPGRPSYAVGVWYWELPTLPEFLVAQTARVDEIWVASRFVQSAFRRVARCPVHIVPPVVPELVGSGKKRADFGLADHEVVFLFSFDVHSMVARKNPEGVLRAFELAFPRPADTGVRLVIKVLNLDRHPPVERWLRPAVAAVNGVIVDVDLDHGELVDLVSCSDAYVSLHRSEGFGFGIAEAMALAKPVIATAYSGNVDFATSANSFQVGYRLSRIKPADHAFGEGAAAVYLPGAAWAEPDIGQAARWMRLVAGDPELRRRVGEAGRATIQERYSARAAIEVVTERLSEIRTTLASGK